MASCNWFKRWNGRPTFLDLHRRSLVLKSVLNEAVLNRSLCFFTNFMLSSISATMAFSPPSFRQDKVPYRVIDVDATLLSNGGFRFCKAYSISDFCVISHKWNDHVLALMTEIKGIVTEELPYPEAVKEKKWADVQATKVVYQSIKEFLEILQADGVKKVWMDTLCIDQTEGSVEKGREIPLMGAYYRHSSACYVPINGFGFNYQLKMGQQMPELEWLNRVWTLQEYLLPDKLYFLVELELWMEEWLSRRVATAGNEVSTPSHLSHFCSCCVGNFGFTHDTMKRMSRKMEGVSCQIENITKPDVNRTCQHCGSPPLLRRAFKTEGNKRIYLVQGEAIFPVAALAQFHKHVETQCWNKQEKTLDLMLRSSFLLRVMHVKKRGTWFEVFEIFREIQKRQCTEERDRILGVLGLLGVESSTNKQQVLEEEKGALQHMAMARTPEEQLVQLASSGAFTEQLLVEMCWMDKYSGQSMPQMSWIPDFSGQSSKIGVPQVSVTKEAKKFHSMATAVRVAPEGPLTLTVKVLKGYVTCEGPHLAWQATEHPMKEDLFFVNDSIMSGRKDRHSMATFQLEYKYPPDVVERFNKQHPDIIDAEDRSIINGREISFDEDGSLHLPFEHPTPFKGFQMWLLYLGLYRGKGKVLLCLHKRGAGSELHKIGTLNASYMNILKVLDNKNNPPQVVTIAGYGKYLDGLVDS